MHPTGLVINWRTPMPSLQYINEKLSDAIYTLTIHEGDARKRVASVPPILKKIKSKHFSIKFGKKI